MDIGTITVSYTHLDVYKRQVVTMGLPKAEEVLREAMAMGADKGILVTDRVLGGADTWATSVSYTHLDVYKRQILLSDR